MANCGRIFLAVVAACGAVAHYALAAGSSTLTFLHPMALLAGVALAVDLRRPATACRPLNGVDSGLFALALLACASPFRMMAFVGLAAAAALIWRDGPARRPAAVLMALLASWVLKDGVWVDFISSPVLAAEAQIIRQLLDFGGIAASGEGNRIALASGRDFMILRECSVLSLAYPCAVGTYALCQLLRPSTPVGWRRIGAALGLLLVFNTARLVGMVASTEIYAYLHGASGSTPLQLAWAAIVMTAALPESRGA
jgi:hypothetical protein